MKIRDGTEIDKLGGGPEQPFGNIGIPPTIIRDTLKS
jgi:hypothetical protein